MSLEPSREDLHQLATILSESRRVLVFTGAGISAESGIATYRGQGGTWTKYDPEIYASIDYFRRDPSYFWTFFREVRLGMITTAQPNKGHYTLAEWERLGKVRLIVTQNIDGLHQRAGSQKVVELHGNTTRFYCLSCGRHYDLEHIKELLEKEVVPHCECKGVIRPDVVLFGELLPPGAMEIALAEARECDLCLSIGSSLVVYPAAEVPYTAKIEGARLVIINLDPTPLDELADQVYHYPSGSFLHQVGEVFREMGGIATQISRE
ncbi:MAG: SIR2 family NAD-dependent protein deacylase [bacterium]